VQTETASQSTLKKRFKDIGQKIEKEGSAQKTIPETMQISFYKNADELCSEKHGARCETRGRRLNALHQKNRT
jgi:hypothetical protein